MNDRTLIPARFQRLGTAETVSDNERVILNLVRRATDPTRADLTRATGLTAQSVSRIVDTLVQRGLLQMGERMIHGRGQPSTQVQIAPNAMYAIGVSIMTDAISAALMNFSGQVIGQRKLRWSRHTKGQFLDKTEAIIDALLKKANVDRKRVFGIGVGMTGYLTGKSGQFNPPPPLDALALIDIESLISERMNLPVWADNDGNVAAMGEGLTGAGLKHATFAYIYFSKGIGGSLVIDNNLFRGAFGNAGEFAGVLHPDAHEQRPTLELLREMINARGGDLKSINDLVEGFDCDWPGVDAWIESVSPHLCAMISAISAVVDPEAIVLGGRLPRSLAVKLIDRLEYYSVPRRDTPKPFPKLLPSEVEGDATAIGAAAMLLKQQFFG